MLNIAVLMGRLTADPELRRTSSDIPVTSFTLAVDRNFARDKTDFIDVVCWRSTAEFASKYFHKGQLVAVQGPIQTRTYTDSQNIKRKAFEISAEQVHFAESKRDSMRNGVGQPAGPAAGPRPEGKPAAPSNNETQKPDEGDDKNGDFIELNDSDDDLPF